VFDSPKTFCVRNVFSLFAADFSNSCINAAIDPPQIPLGATFGLALGDHPTRTLRQAIERISPLG
jgi:hypothetical protein